MSLIFGISGRKGHGKDTFCNFVREFDSEFQILHFADDLKTMCGEIFNLTPQQMYEPALKEIPFTWYGQKTIYMDDYLEDIRRVTGLDIQPQEKIAKTPRRVLQYFGTEYVRSVKDSFWVDRVIDKINAIGKKCLVADMRFPNEVEALREINATLIRVQRPDLKSDGDVHDSEAMIDKLEVDYNFEIFTGELEKSKGYAQDLVQGKFS